MATELNSQTQHAQSLASLASGHFVQQNAVAHDNLSSAVDSQLANNTLQIVDMSRQAIVKLVADTDAPPVVEATPTSPFNLRRKRKMDLGKNLRHEEYKLIPAKDRPGQVVDHGEPLRHDEYKLIPSKDRSGAKGFDMRRPVRPIDRQKMRPWLKNLLDTGSVFGLNWVHKDEGIFQISWRHASRLGWNLETDGDVFERWARHTGIFKDGDDPEPKRWKANFRCALHSLPDVKELTSPTDRKGRNASRTYRFLRPNEVQPPVKRKQRYNIQIPYNAYENQASEDSGSQHAESDERVTDEETYTEQVRSFPHCDHDYALRFEKYEEEKTSEILPRHNSGYVLIKSKDAHAFEFRLTPPDSVAKPSNSKKASPKSSPPPKKAKMGKKGAVSGGSPLKKGKGKVIPKDASKKDKKGGKKPKKGVEKEVTSSTKVSLKSLLSGHKKTGGGKKEKAGPAPSQAGKRVAARRGGKKVTSTTARMKTRSNAAGGDSGGPSQAQGLQALLEAAVEIDRMDAQTSASSMTPANTKTMSPAKRPGRAVTSLTSAVTSSAVMSAPHTTATIDPSALASGGSRVPYPVAISSNVLSAIPAVLTPGHTMVNPATIPPQVSLSMLQKFLGLSAVPTPTVQLAGTSSAATAESVALSSVGAVDSSGNVKLLPRPPSGEVGVCQNGEGVLTKAVLATPTPAPVLMTQPEAGTSMLKHLLRLTSPTLTTPSLVSPSAPAPTTTPTILASFIKPTPQANLKDTAGTKTAPSEIVAVEAGRGVKKENIAVDESGLTNYQIVTQYEVGASHEGAGQEETDTKNFPYTRVSTSKVYIKPECIEAADSSSSTSSVVVGSLPPVTPQLSDITATPQSAVFIQPHEDTPGNASTQQISAAQSAAPVLVTCATDSSQPMTVPQVASSMPQVTLCLNPVVNVSQLQQGSSGVAQTMTLALPPQASIPASDNPAASTTTFTQSMDLLQLLNLCVASGNGQVIIKTESPSSDVSVMSSAYSSEKTMTSSTSVPAAEGTASAAPKFILVDTSLQMPTGVNAVPDVIDSVQATQEPVVVPLANSILSEAVNNAPVATSTSSAELSESVNSASSSTQEEGLPVLTHEIVKLEPVEGSSGTGVEVVTNQFIMNEADISSLSEDQPGSDSFVVESML